MEACLQSFLHQVYGTTEVAWTSIQAFQIIPLHVIRMILRQLSNRFTPTSWRSFRFSNASSPTSPVRTRARELTSRRRESQQRVGWILAHG